jgi:hypothetical protein
MRKALSLILVLCFLIGFAGCADPKPTTTPTTTTTTSNTQVQQQPAQTQQPQITQPIQQQENISQQQTTQPASKVTPPPPVQKKEVTVYVTRTGGKYHSAGCQYLSKSCIPISLSDAKASYGPCSKCNPPE